MRIYILIVNFIQAINMPDFNLCTKLPLGTSTSLFKENGRTVAIEMAI